MKGVISHFRQNRHTTYGNQMIVVVKDLSSRDQAKDYIGKEVIYNTGKKVIKGKVASAHGNKGALRVLFETGMPGQSIGREVEIK